MTAAVVERIDETATVDAPEVAEVAEPTTRWGRVWAWMKRHKKALMIAAIAL